jgi:DnaJ-class molecular chaperone
MRDPYSILGVNKNADQQQIKAAWRATAKALHPDQNPGDPQAARRFTEAGRAYDLLKDPNKRRLFDDARARASGDGEKTFMQQREERARAQAEARATAQAKATSDAKMAAEVRARAAAAAAAQPKQPHREEPQPAEDVVAKIFGTSKSADARENTAHHAEPKQARSHPDESGLDADEDAAHGHETRHSPALDLISYVFRRLTRQVPAPERAPDLNIEVQVSIEDILSRFAPQVTLPDGTQQTIRLPDDVKDGTQIRMEGRGYLLPHVKRGDLVVTLRVKPHTWYRPHGYDLLTYVDIDIENAVLGCEATVETTDGQSKVTIPPWTSSGYKVTVAGKGLPKGHGMRGNLVAEVRVQLWERPDQKIIDLMRSLKEGLYL